MTFYVSTVSLSNYIVSNICKQIFYKCKKIKTCFSFKNNTTYNLCEELLTESKKGRDSHFDLFYILFLCMYIHNFAVLEPIFMIFFFL